MSFYVSKNFDFLPLLHFPKCEPIEVINETKLLAGIISSNLSWSSHIDYITSQATKKLCVLVCFKSLGASTHQLLQVYQTRVRSTIEFAALVFHSGLTKEYSRRIELCHHHGQPVHQLRVYLGAPQPAATRYTARKLVSLLCGKHKSVFPYNANHRLNIRIPK